MIHVKNEKYERETIKINSNLNHDDKIDKMIAPQKHILDSLMNVVITTSDEELIKDKPNGTLNNFCADIMLQIGKRYDNDASICIINYGGIRLNSIPKGNITKGKIYELMPFDNMIVIQKINGNDLIDILNYIASQGGWPIAGISMEIKNSKSQSILVNGYPIDNNKIYTMVISDYLANGGDNLNILKKIPQTNTGLIMREAFIEELQKIKTIYPNKEKRIKNVD
jgi:2',3'-cyclic-nucleotide 2'-phosphodiesterase (5'-nucleotidase family)